MKRRFGVLVAVLAMCLALAVPVYAANERPAVELMYVTFEKDSANGYSPTLFFRINSEKEVKYCDWYLTLFNRVDDPTPNEITNSSTVRLQIVGPLAKDKAITSNLSRLNQTYGQPFDAWHWYDFTGRYVSHNKRRSLVYLDDCGNYFILDDEDRNPNSCIFLTNDEIENRTFYQGAKFDRAWYSSVFSYVRLQKVVVTYMDNTTETILGNIAEATRLDDHLNNGYYKSELAKYGNVYNYKDYRSFNPDLISAFGINEYKYFEHFVTSGMKEGRQGSKSFNLAVYKANNPDLVAAFGDDNVKYYEHYITTGKAEGRKAT